MDVVNEFIAQAAASPWVYLVVFAVVLVDAFFPPIPSESVVIAAAAAAVAVGVPNLPLVLLCAAAGAVAGDNLTFAVGRVVRLDRLRFTRRPRIRAALDRATRGIHSRAGVLILSARYVPVGRVAVNLVAGASGLPARRFFGLSLIAGSSWALYSATVGVVAAHWLHGNAALAMLVGIALGVGVGFAVDGVLRRVARRREAAGAGAADADTGDGAVDDLVVVPAAGGDEATAAATARTARATTVRATTVRATTVREGKQR